MYGLLRGSTRHFLVKTRSWVSPRKLICLQEKYATEVGLNDSDLVPVYVSIAQTLSDLKKYDEAVEYFMKELECRHGEHKQVEKDVFRSLL